jgi:hypothetical protein
MIIQSKSQNVYASPNNQLIELKRSWAERGLIILFADEATDISKTRTISKTSGSYQGKAG